MVAKKPRVTRRKSGHMLEMTAFEGVREIDEAPAPKYSVIPLGSEKDEKVNLNSVNTIARISIASPERILSWSRRHSRAGERRLGLSGPRLGNDLDLSSFGEVKKPETINYRTFKPEKDGLFCERIFGPTKNWECACGKYKRPKYKGIVCDRCGVEVIESKVRRTRMGHIRLAAPVCHIWFYKGTSSRISHLLDMSVKDLGKVIYFQNHIVVDPGEARELKLKQLLTDEETRKARETYSDKVDIRIGAEAVKELLKQLDINELSSTLAIEMRRATSAQRRGKIIKRLKVVDAFRNSENKPEWMVLDILPVIPPELRPLVHLDGGRFATSDLNDLYRRVINRNNRLKKLMELKAPEVILRNEKRMLQEAVDALFDNSRRTRPTKGPNNRPLKSLADMLKGKQGRFRQNLLGKRVDYSGRSVIVVGPELKFNECGLPKKMALELFDPFIIRELKARGFVATIKNAKRMMEREAPEVYDILDDIIKDHPVLLNRAPTLHRLGVQAFMPKLIEGKAIQLHPLACAAFNADFDGDQMAVHIPLSTEAKIEAKHLMLAENNILSPANGRPIATPTQDTVLGIFYMTKTVPNDKRYAKCKNDKDRERLLPRLSSIEECITAYNYNQVQLQEEVEIRIARNRRVKTTPGRAIFSKVLPDKVDFFDTKYPFNNQVLTKSQLVQIVALAHKTVGKAATARMLDNIKNLGYYFAKKGGISIAIHDMVVPTSKSKLLAHARKQIEKVTKHYNDGLITDGERYSKIIHEWQLATDQVAADMMGQMQRDQKGLNSIYMMANSGARGNEAQIRQLAGMRGLMQKPTKKITGEIGEIIESPITSNFREGLSVLEYFISTHGARKGLADTALKTSDAGYLTRRLVDVAQDLFITEEDCGTDDGIEVTALTEVTSTGERELEPLADRIIGRVASEDIVAVTHGTRKAIVARNQEILQEHAFEIKKAGIETVSIRSALTCRTRRGLCANCYGRNLATNKHVELGEAVGVIAAQSIGEPGTQLTLRTFHIGGIASVQVEGWYQAARDGIVRFRNLEQIQLEDGKEGVVNRMGSIDIEDTVGGSVVQRLPNIPYGARLLVREDTLVKRGERLVEWEPNFTPILAEIDGIVRLVDIEAGLTMEETYDAVSESRQRIIIEHKEDLHPTIQMLDREGNILAKYALSAGTILSREIENGHEVRAGHLLARIPRARAKSKDITGGLPRVDELFEARKPKDAAVIAEINGILHIKGSAKGSAKISITGDDGEERQYSIPMIRHLIVRDGERVHAGDIITDGTPTPHEILAVKGEKAVMEFLVQEIQEVYRLQKVNINDKHIECIVRQMLKKVYVEEVGNTRFLYGQQIDKWEFEEENRITIAKGGACAKGRPKLLGLTKASLETESFISAASFQETTRVLTDAAVRGRYDQLRGLKENIIMGLLIPAGTGLPFYRNTEVRPPYTENTDNHGQPQTTTDEERED